MFGLKLRCEGAIVRGVLTLIGAGIVTCAGLWTPEPDGGTLHIRLAPLAATTVAKRPSHGRVHRRNLLSGVASWYGEVLDGHTTASGEIFHKEALTACHPTLPFGTLVRVINLRNMRSVVVRINDRGRLDPGRVIDLSSAAADQIGMLRAGVAPVKLEVVRAHA